MASNPITTIDPKEALHFGGLAADWWNPKGSSAMLHKLNPVRLSYIRSAIDAHWGLDPRGLKPLSGKKALDVGCGAGLLCEPLARLGADVTGLDAAPENIEAANTHAQNSGLMIDYRAHGVEQLGADESFDLVTSMEVIEHVTDPEEFVIALVEALSPGGLMILSTPNRTALSRLAMITLGEGAGLIPKGTHDWNKFLTPYELEGVLEKAGMAVQDRRGIAFDPRKGMVLSETETINYILTAVRT